ncbi:U32 family peptidase [Clostridia bacterium OttesenSCG-928-F22]|nr:U32 family peptidase [Clostridia bacterium OttesenSCG-928-F22]
MENEGVSMGKVELLAPAGDMEKLRQALYFGADAVYLGGSRMNLRAFSSNFEDEAITSAAALCHTKQKKLYVTLNSIPHNEDLVGLEEYIAFLASIGVDGLIVSDVGVISIAKKAAPDLPLHLSVQANCTNHASANFYHSIGVERIILSRELSLAEISEIRSNTPKSLMLEAFVHGAMCMSYSGRCHMSHVMTGRDANRGACAQPCRWKYALLEETREDLYYPVEQDEKGSYILSAYDLMMIEHLDALQKAGVESFKIEGRMKTVYYVSNVINAYRRALSGGENIEALKAELYKSSHRPYDTGFYFGIPSNKGDAGAYEQGYDFVGLVKGYDDETGRLFIEQRNAFAVGEELEVLSPGGQWNKSFIVQGIKDEKGQLINRATIPQQVVTVPADIKLSDMDILRRKRN